MNVNDDDRECEGDWAGEHRWPSFCNYEFKQLTDGNRFTRLAVTAQEQGADVYAESEHPDSFSGKRKITIFHLSSESALDLSDALSRVVGRLPEDATTTDVLNMEYFRKVEEQMRSTAAFLKRLPLTPVTAAEIRAIENLLATKPNRKR